jgi:hypothetical protein
MSSGGDEAKHPMDGPVLCSDVTLFRPQNVSLQNLVHRLVALDAPARTTEPTKMLLRTDPLLDGAVILLQDFYPILSAPVTAAQS